MTAADANALAPVQALLRQLRELKGLREARPGVFTVRGSPFAQFRVDDAGVLVAELKKPGGSGFDRYPMATSPQHRKFLDDARLRAGRLDDD